MNDRVLFCLRLLLAVMLALAGGLASTSMATPTSPTPAATVAKKWWDAPMQFVVVRHSSAFCEPDCPQWIAAEGRITSDSAVKLERFLGNATYRKLPVLLTSPGGDLIAAMRMGRTLRKYAMTTAVGDSQLFGCEKDDLMAGRCKPDSVLMAYNGLISEKAFCASACPLVLLGGTTRIVSPSSLVGLHEPKSTAQPYIDRYIIHYRLVNGRKEEISRNFLKRTYLPVKTTIGVTPDLRKKFESYIKDMGGSAEIVDEMEKAAPANMDWISGYDGTRERLGLVSKASTPVALEDLSAPTSCNPQKTMSSNCVHLKAKEPQKTAAP